MSNVKHTPGLWTMSVGSMFVNVLIGPGPDLPSTECVQMRIHRSDKG